MSLILELGHALGEMLIDYANEKKWSKARIFFVTCGSFFALFSTHILIFPIEGGMVLGMVAAFCMGIVFGIFFAGLMYCLEKFKR